jgi:hypothetical protein
MINEHKKIKFAYISPCNYLDIVEYTKSDYHLILAHLLINKKYVEFYNKCYDIGHTIILDNSCFEFKRPIGANELIEMIEGSGIKVDIVIAPDYLYEKGKKTVEAAKKFVNQLRDKNYDYDIMTVPQSEENDVDDWLECHDQLQHINGIDYIGMSILGIANAFSALTGTKDIMINRLYASNYIIKNNLNLYKTWYHYLGLGSPRELLLQRQIGLIDGNDSSSPIWHGINGITYDDSATGLINGKLEAPVNFEIENNHKPDIYSNIVYNINFIEKLCKG